MKIRAALPALILCLCLMLSPAAAAAGASMENFAALPRTAYTPGQFADVDEDAWYGANAGGAVKAACELGIMSGRGGGVFDPDGAVRLSEALKMAAVVRSVYAGGGGAFTPAADDWARVYIDYCLAQGIITPETFGGRYDRAATRAEMAHIFANALPESELAARNAVETLPDVDADTPYAADIFALYRCGALQGNDARGTFTPDAGITRAAAAAILVRVALPGERLTFTLEAAAPEPAYTPGMWVEDLDALRPLYQARLWGLYAEMRVRMSWELASALHADSGIYNEWVPAAADLMSIYNEDGDGMMVYEWSNRSPDFEMDALLRDPSVAPRASARTRGHLAQIDAILASLSLEGKSERERLLAIHDWMTANLAYDLTFAEDSYWYYGALENGTAVCQGYAELFCDFAVRAGSDCAVVTGMAGGADGWEGHAWNVVYLAGDPTAYFIDVTFDDPVPDTRAGRHDYFLVTAQTLSADHSW